MRPVYVRDVGFWSPGYASGDAWCRAEFDDTVESPDAELLSGALRRRATALTRMSIEVFAQATRTADSLRTDVRSIWATSHGEHTTAIRILGMMQRGEGKLSPTHFHNSVHNAASGYASIATQNHTASTTLSGGTELVSAALLEAMCHLETAAGEIVLVLADEPLQVPFERSNATSPLAMAFCFSSDPRGAVAVLSNLRTDAVARVKPHDHFGRLYIAAALPLFEHVVLRRPGTVALELEGDGLGPVYCVDVEIAGA